MFDEKKKQETFMEKVKRKAQEAFDSIGTTGYWVGYGLAACGALIGVSIGNKINSDRTVTAVQTAYKQGKEDQRKYDNQVLDNAMDIAIRIHDGDK